MISISESDSTSSAHISGGIFLTVTAVEKPKSDLWQERLCGVDVLSHHCVFILLSPCLLWGCYLCCLLIYTCFSHLPLSSPHFAGHSRAATTLLLEVQCKQGIVCNYFSYFEYLGSCQAFPQWLGTIWTAIHQLSLFGFSTADTSLMIKDLIKMIKEFA